MKTRHLRQELGQIMTVVEVAAFLDVDPVTVRKYYQQLRGLRLGRTYRFFEKEVLNAIQKSWSMDGANKKEQQEDPEKVSNKSGSHSMGGGTKEGGPPTTASVSIARKDFTTDTHNLLD